MLRILAFGILVGTVATALAAPQAKRPVDPGVRGGCPAGPAWPYVGRGSVLPRWPRQVPKHRGRHWRCKQWAGPPFQLQPVLVLPLAARCRREQP